MGSQGLVLSLLSGFLASMASVLGKVAMDSENAGTFCQTVVVSWLGKEKIEAIYICESTVWWIRLLLLAAMLLCNALMWTIFTKALRLSSATVQVTVVNLASNFFCSAIFGQTFFGERLTALWYIGTVIIIIGLALIHVGNQQTGTDSKKIDKERHCDTRYPGPGKIYERHKARKFE